MLGSSAVLAQGDPRANPAPVQEAKPEAKSERQGQAGGQKARDKPEAKSETAAEAKPEPKAKGRHKEAKAKPAKDTKEKTTNGSASPSAPLKPSGLQDTYAAIPAADRAAIQNDLTWGGDYTGPIDGEFSERLVAAVKAYQTRHKNPVTGVMSAEERAALGHGRRAAQARDRLAARRRSDHRRARRRARPLRAQGHGVAERHPLVVRARPVADRDVPHRHRRHASTACSSSRRKSRAAGSRAATCSRTASSSPACRA